jgi:D-amino peptidase
MRASEFLIYAYAASELGIPVIFVSGDAALCDSARQFVPGIAAVAVNEGSGDSVTAIHPDEAVELIQSGVKAAVEGFLLDPKACIIEPYPSYLVEVRYISHTKAFRCSRYPGAERIDETRVGFRTKYYDDVLRFFTFVL